MVRAVIDNNVAVVHIERNIISDNVELLESKINEAKIHDAVNFIFDFHNTEYLCSAALGIIAQTLRVSFECSGKIVFCSMSAKLEELFTSTKFLRVVDSTSSLEDAMKKFR